jgi:hypothetical protein
MTRVTMTGIELLAKAAAAYTKTAAELDKTVGGGLGDAAVLGGTALAAPRLLNAGAERVLGAQRFVHGTSPLAANSILDSGLQPSFGGHSSGSSVAVDSPRYINQSQNRIHVALDNVAGRRLVAGPHAALAHAQQDALASGKKLSFEEQVKAFRSGLFGRGGKIVGGAVPYEAFKQVMEQDPDHIPHIAFRSNQAIGPAQLSSGRAGLRQIVNARADNLLKYLKKNPLRFAGGAGALGLAGLAMEQGGKSATRLVNRGLSSLGSKDDKATA